MKEFFKYIIFYHKLTDCKIYIYMVISFFSVAFEGMSLLSIVPIMELGKKDPSRYAVIAYEVMGEWGISSQNEQLLSLLIFGTVCFSLGSLGTIMTKIYIARLQTYLLRKVEMDINNRLFNTPKTISHYLSYINNLLAHEKR